MFGSLIRNPHPGPAVDPKNPDPAQLYQQQLGANQLHILSLLPIPQVELADDEKQSIQIYQMASLVLGPAAVAPMVCSEDCPSPFKSTCPLARIGKAPVGDRCPFEQQYVGERFIGWLNELGRTLEDLCESERSAITTLVTLDLQERRCAAILAAAENAQLTSKSVTDVDVNTGTPIAWEQVIHQNAVRMNEIIDKRRALLRDLELTSEMKTKRLKALGQVQKSVAGKDFASRSSDISDKVRKALRGEPQVVTISS